ncbi:MAG TPA: hypothetical protein VN476_14510, partial [Pyrinomonadaceae bacterium]|nr:hypothetical protein [Pyrinomonadaceae bacterium]
MVSSTKTVSLQWKVVVIASLVVIATITFLNLCTRRPRQDTGCIPTTYDEGAITASPDTGQAAPDVVVPSGSQVTLSGLARHVSIDRQCRVTTSNIDAHWQISYRPPGQVPIDITSELRLRNNSEPSAAALAEGLGENCGAGFARCASGDIYQANFSARAGTYYVTLGGAGIGSITRKILSGDCNVDWINIGPEVDTSSCEQNGVCSTGRIYDVAFNPDNENRLYIATAGGGLWRSDDFGD